MSRLEALIAWVLLALAVALLRFGVVLQSDALFYDDLVNDLLVHGGAWHDWKFSGAPGFLPDMALYLAGYVIFDDAASRMLFVSGTQAIALAALSVALVRRLAPHAGASLDAQVVLAAAFATLTSAQSGMWLYFHTTNNHFGTVLLGLAATMLTLGLARRFAWPQALALLAVVGAATASSRLFLLTFTLPCLALAGLALLAALRRRDRAWHGWRAAALAPLATVLVAGQALAMLLERLLIHHIPVEGRPPLSLASIHNSLDLFMAATRDAFDADNGATLILALALAACLLYLLIQLAQHLRHRNRLDGDRAAVLALVCASLPITIAGSVLSGAIVDKAGYRYLAFPLALAVPLAIVLANRAVTRHRVRHAAWALCALLVAANAFQFATRATPRTDPSTAVAQCIASTGGFAFRAGIADYWNARAVSYQLPRRPPIVATLHDLTPLFWVSTLGPFVNPARYPGYDYNFAILRRPGGNDQFNYTPDTIGRRLPRPSRIQACADGVTELWLYDDDRLHGTVQAAITTFMQQRKNNP